VDARYDGGTGQIFGEIALPMSAGAFAAEPFAGLAYVHISRDRFSEQGDVAALSSHGADDDVGFSTLGVRFAWESRLRGTRIVPRASVAWQHAFGDVEATQVLSFAGAPSMTIAGTPLARNTARIEAGLDISLSPSATLGIVYNGEIASDIEDHGLSGRFSFRF
jgi:outer membrane autotransporter protein